MTNEFMGYLLTTDECEALHECLMEIREKKKQEQRRYECKREIFSKINEAVNAIGLAETKRIMRELNRELRVNTTD